jgi:hypothetical protein
MIPHADKGGRFLVNIAFLGLPKGRRRQVDVALVGDHIKGLNVLRHAYVVVFLVDPLRQEQHPRPVAAKVGRGDMTDQPFNVISTVGRVGNQNVKGRIAMIGGPYLITIFFCIVDIGKAQGFSTASRPVHCNSRDCKWRVVVVEEKRVLYPAVRSLKRAQCLDRLPTGIRNDRRGRCQRESRPHHL